MIDRQCPTCCSFFRYNRAGCKNSWHDEPNVRLSPPAIGGEALYGTAANPLRAVGTIEEIARRVKLGKWTTLDLDALADFALAKAPQAAPEAKGETQEAKPND